MGALLVSRRNPTRGAGHKREPGRHLALPNDFLNSILYARISTHSLKLLLDLGAQYNLENNGRLVACFSVLKKRGWKSEETLFKARRELEREKIIVETRKGGRPNRASWYALTFFDLDPHRDQDITPRAFVRGAWRMNGALVISRNVATTPSVVRNTPTAPLRAVGT